MKLRMMVGLVTAASMVMLVAPSAQAAEPRDVAPVVQTQAATAPSTLLPLKPYVHAAPAGFVLDAPASVLATVDPSAVAGLQSYYALIAKWVANGELKLSGGTYVSTVATLGGSGAHGRWSTQWYGMSAAADSYLISKIRAGMTAAGIASMIGAPAGPGQAVALAMSIGVLVLTACQQSNGWAYVYWIGGFPPVGAMVCNPFA